MGLVADFFRGRDLAPQSSERDLGLSLDQWMSFFGYGGNLYPTLNQTMGSTPTEKIGNGFSGIVTGAFQNNGVVAACEFARFLLFSEMRFQFRQIRAGRPGDLFGTPALAPLEHPSPGQTTGDLLARLLLDADFAGTGFTVRRGAQLKRLRPDWVTIIIGSPNDSGPDVYNGDPDAEVIGYAFQPGGPGSGRDPIFFGADQVAAFAPLPDPLASFRGMPWITPVIREVMGDAAASQHKLAFFENGATVNLVVTMDPTITEDAFGRWVELFNENHEGAANAYRTLFLGGGATPTVVGSNLQQADFKTVQAAGEVRIAAAAGMHPAIIGLSEGLQGASLNAGNFQAASRLTGDKTLRPLWRNLCGSMASIIDVPANAELWYDARDVAFLQSDVKDAAEIQQVQANSIKALTDAGFDADTVIEAITAGDWGRLKHSGLFSVQLQPPMPDGPATDAPVPPDAKPAALPEPPTSNGKAKALAKT